MSKYIRIKEEHLRHMLKDIMTVLDSTEIYRHDTYNRLHRTADYIEARLKANE